MNIGWVTVGVFLAVQLAVLVIRLLYRGPILRKLDVEVAFSVARATEGDKVRLSTTLTNAKWLPLPWVAVKFRVSRDLLFPDTVSSQVSDFYYRQDLYHVLMHQRVTRRFEFVCGKRGFYTIDGLDITGWDILMDNKSAQFHESDAKLTVYPATLEPTEAERLITMAYGQMQSFVPMFADPFSFRGIRAYAPNDPMKAVNFKASAKGAYSPGQELMVNLWEFTNNRRVILMLNLEKHNLWHSDAQDEYSIKLAATFARRLAADNVPMRFVTNGVQVPEGRGFAYFEGVLEVLAHVDLKQEYDSVFSDALAQVEEDAEYILISTYHGADWLAAYDNLLARGVRVVWLLPCNQGIKLDEGDMREKVGERALYI